MIGKSAWALAAWALAGNCSSLWACLAQPCAAKPEEAVKSFIGGLGELPPPPSGDVAGKQVQREEAALEGFDYKRAKQLFHDKTHWLRGQRVQDRKEEGLEVEGRKVPAEKVPAAEDLAGVWRLVARARKGEAGEYGAAGIAVDGHVPRLTFELAQNRRGGYGRLYVKGNRSPWGEKFQQGSGVGIGRDWWLPNSIGFSQKYKYVSGGMVVGWALLTPFALVAAAPAPWQTFRPEWTYSYWCVLHAQDVLLCQVSPEESQAEYYAAFARMR